MEKYNRVIPKKKSFAKKIFIVFIVVMVLILIFSLIGLYNRTDVNKINEDIKVEQTGTTVQAVEEKNRTVEAVIEEVNHGVVGISKIQNIGSSIFAQDGIEKLGLGTGIIASPNGYIITNKHVSGDKYSSCYVTLENGNTYDANVVWADATLDLSIVKVNLSGLQSIKLGDSNSVKAGQTVYAVGNPIGYEFERTVTSGIISAKARTLKFNENGTDVLMTDLIQTDATINPGNSGGPLINVNGEVIGINTLKIDTAEGIGFAVPINVVKPIIEKYSTTGNFEEPTIGISGFDKDIVPYIDKNLKLDSGIYIEDVTAKSPAETSGLKKGDIILKIDDKTINSMNDIKEYVYTKNPGDTVKIEYRRGGISNIVDLTLGKR